ncbi:sulfotransferase family protein [Alteromonas sp. McT4-15]|uniref:sulfotransferase family protein n=1 Tax=Alteromonas sp. McT4-15 TaxID=2881256 RepID=UPI001CF8DA6D|nr:sulfotransferase family protein [Alteromonas sp. McT4-15]MCB4438254.1 sulfotransferase family protein [Alteromonas sp. McT4-15]
MSYYNFIVTRDRRFIFAYNPKVACTNWKCVFRYYDGARADYLAPDIAHDRERSGLDFLSQLNEPDVYLRDKTIKKFSFVRNPYSRILSAYANKIEPYVNKTRSEIDDNPYFYEVFGIIEQHYGRKITSVQQGFVAFLNWILNVNDFHSTNEHWLPQSKLLDIDNVSYDFIGRLEHVKEDSAHIIKQLELDIPFPKQKDVKFAPTNATERLSSFMTKEAVSLINEIYKEDFQNFDYLMD